MIFQISNNKFVNAYWGVFINWCSRS